MIYGLDKYGLKIMASPLTNAICPLCQAILIPKCGAINNWHWAHISLNDCDYWHEHETSWHIDWKTLFPANQTEVVIKKDDFIHRADAMTAKGIVIEFQNSSISSKEIIERENFYEQMYWIINGDEIKHHFLWATRDGQSLGYSIYDNSERLKSDFHFIWRFFRKSWSFARMPIFIDFNDGKLLLIKELKFPYYGFGFGKIIHKQSILKLATAIY